MDELKRRFASLDQVPTPELWPAIEQRAEALGQTPVVGAVRAGRATGVGPGAQPSRPLVAWLVAVGLIAALVAGVVASGALRPDPLLVAVPPSGPPSTAAPEASGPAPSGLTPDASGPVPSGLGTAGCVEPDPVSEPRLTPVTIPDYAMDFDIAACSVWLNPQTNGAGIIRIDPATGDTIATIVPDEVVRSIAVHDGALWAITHPSQIVGDAGVRLVRIDPATNAVVDVRRMPKTGDLAFLGNEAWVHDWHSMDWIGDLTTGAPATQGPELGPAIGTAFGSLWMAPGEDGRLGRIEPGDHEVSTWVHVGARSICTIADLGIACVDGLGIVTMVSPETNQPMWIVPLSDWAPNVAAIAALGDSIWVQPIELAPGRTDAPGLIELDAATGKVQRQLPLPVGQPLDLWSGAGSLWMAGAEQPLNRLDLPPR